MVTCKNCALRECEGREGMIVCDQDGEDHKPEYTCDQAEEEETISIEFSEKQFDYIQKYMDHVKAVDIQTAVMNAVSIAFDDAVRN